MKNYNVLGIVLIASLSFGSPLRANDESAIASVTAQDPNIPVTELDLLLKPLTASELVIEADAWMELLKAKVREISELRIKIARAAAAGDATPAAETAEEGAEPEISDADLVIQHVAERTQLIDRLGYVLTALEVKGGDRKEYDTFISAVSGLAETVDVTDASAIWGTVSGWLRSPEGGIRWGFNIAKFIVVVVAFWILSMIIGAAVRKSLAFSKRISELLRQFAVSFSRRVTMLVGLMIGLTMLEVNVGPLLAVIGAAGFVVGFALQGTLGNFASGIMILAYRPFDVGDVIDAGGVTGTVESLTLVSTQVKTPDNRRVIVPNNAVWGGVITNVTGSPTRRVDMTFGIGYDDDLKKAKSIMDDILSKHDKILKDPEPVVRVHELADSSVNFICRPWVKTEDYWDVYWDITHAVKDKFDSEGISIPYPQTDIHVHQTA
ncbi:MAG: mechanosensitive ion channel family protein [Planctomycetota bacterium]